MPAWLNVLPVTTEQREFFVEAFRRIGKPDLGLMEMIDHLKADEAAELLAIVESASASSGKAAVTGSAESYLRHRERVGKREKEKSRSGRDIGPLPPVTDPDRKESCRLVLRKYLETYHPHWFSLAWSEDHLRIIAKIQTAVLIGGLQAIAMPRGSGKTTICMGAVLWSANYGHHQYQMLLHANKDKGKLAGEILQLECETNPLLLEDFPEVVYPIRCLERQANRAKGQLYNGQPTYLQWSGDKLVLPVIPGSAASGRVICVGGIQEAIRGALYLHPATGKLVRPSLALVDDPQDRATAKSELLVNQTIQLISADLLGCAGPGKPMSALMPMTVIEPGDVASNFLDREKFPQWRGERCQMLVTFPTNMELWDEYDAIRRRSFKRAEEDEPESAEELWAECNAFYEANRDAMDEGAKVSWEERKYPHERSAIQHAMNLYLAHPPTFYSEYQNDPQMALDQEGDILTADEIARKLSGFERDRIPAGCQYVTGFIDVHKTILYYCLIAWTPTFDGYILDYGTFPKQKHGHFTQRNARPTLQTVFPGMGLEGAIHAGLEALTKQLFGKKLRRDDGARMPINLVLIDSGWKPDVVFKFCAGSPYESRVAPSLGRKIGPNEKPLSQCKPKVGEHIGHEWTIPPVTGQQVRQIQFDTYTWKTFFHRRLATAQGDRGALSLFGQFHHGIPDVDHGFFADHLSSEYSMPVTGKRTADVWQMKPGKDQNHWFDCAVGATVAASVLGAMIVGLPEYKAKKKTGPKVIYPFDKTA